MGRAAGLVISSSVSIEIGLRRTAGLSTSARTAAADASTGPVDSHLNRETPSEASVTELLVCEPRVARTLTPQRTDQHHRQAKR
ncbi:hypothetical protein AB0H42_19365 [Nocardia sp. NPDC050799]|uniref:hypothetical protein n=1 Tax=Nocardia sp. NPDC050799 TaxID=3154842 RepID=UPI0034037E7A